MAGLTNIPWWKIAGSIDDFKASFKEAVKNVDHIVFDVTDFDPFYKKPGITNFEFNHILENPNLLEKTKFFKEGIEHT